MFKQTNTNPIPILLNVQKASQRLYDSWSKYQYRLGRSTSYRQKGRPVGSPWTYLAALFGLWI